MSVRLEKLQILAPAGSIEQLVAAVNNGCNAVYLGLDGFNARMKAPNFTLENLSEWVDYCHLFGVKVYVAINTSIKNDEFAKAYEMLIGAYKHNADGVIVTDVALMRLASKLPKPFEVVASTQLNIHDKYGAEFVKKLGATTVVCARECTLDNIRDIASAGINVEVFIHGAVCVCQSGQCLFSSMVGGNSGNRGLCAQPCRKMYYAEGASKSGYLLSARDMCGLKSASNLVKAGASTFKIEGRNRRAEYAGLTSRVYRKLFDGNFEIGKNDFAFLAEMFNRGTSENCYLNGCNDGIIYPRTQNHIGIDVGVIKRGKVAASKELHKGEGLKVFDGDKEVCGGLVAEDSDELVSAQFSGKVSDGMKVRRTTNVKLCQDVTSCKRRLEVKMNFVAKSGQKPVIIARCGAAEASVAGDFVVQQAVKTSLFNEELAKQLQKTGETHYTISDIDIDIDDIFLAKSQINNLRRLVLDELTGRIINDYNSRFVNRNNAEKACLNLFEEYYGGLIVSESAVEPCVAAVCYNEEQLAESSNKCKTVIYKPERLDLKAFETAVKYGAFVDLPSFADMNYIDNLVQSFSVKLCCNNWGQVEFARTRGLQYIAGAGLNLFNDYNVCEINDAADFVYSRELTFKEIVSFKKRKGLIFVDGQIPLMQLCHCPYKVAFNCNCSTCKSSEALVYRDELNNRFIIKRRQAGLCLFELFNGSKLSVVNKLKNAGRFLVDYDDAVIRHYVSVNNGIIDGYVESKPYTKGRLYDKIN